MFDVWRNNESFALACEMQQTAGAIGRGRAFISAADRLWMPPPRADTPLLNAVRVTQAKSSWL